MGNKTRLWIKKLIAAVIGGGSSSVTATITVTALDPAKFNPIQELRNFLVLAGATFTVGAVTHLFMYLSQSPVPEDDTQQFVNPNPTPKP
ncbi:MAG: hypothetical protein KGL39_39765 [Patescibacteria group bacterium]|nr:hypothetical protein [Patescibacteria group bacterium]